MKKLKYIITLLFIFSLGYVSSIYTYPRLSIPKLADSKEEPELSPQIETDSVIENNEDQKRPYVVDIPAKYFDPDKVYDNTDAPIPGNIYLLGGNLEITNPPVAIERPTDIKLVNEKYDPEKEPYVVPDFGPIIYSYDIDNDGVFENNIEESESIDVDNDGKLEKIIYGSVAMTHQPHKAVIVKNGQIIYKSDNLMSIRLSGSESHNGFYILEVFNIGSFPMSGGRRITRFINEDGKFIPVWYRDIFDLQTTKP